MSRARSKLKRHEKIAGYLFISPWIVGFILIIGGPLIASLILSFCTWDFLSPAQFVGLENFSRLLRDPLVRKSLKITAVYVGVGCPARVFLALFVALLLNQKIKGLSWYRVMYYSPCVIPIVALSLIWIWMYAPYYGLFNIVLAKLGIKGPNWLQSITWALPALIIMSLWEVGRSMLIYLGGLQGIPTQLYEAADIDGASRWNRFWNITIPMLSPVIFFNLIISIIGSFQVFTPAYIMTNGGPANATLFYVLNLYRHAFTYFDMGYGAALAWVLFLIIIGSTLLVFKSSPMWVYYEAEVKR